MSILPLLNEISLRKFQTDNYGEGLINYISDERNPWDHFGFFCVIEPEAL